MKPEVEKRRRVTTAVGIGPLAPDTGHRDGLWGPVRQLTLSCRQGPVQVPLKHPRGVFQGAGGRAAGLPPVYRLFTA